MGAQHQGSARRDVGEVVDEDDATGAKALDDEAVVDYLVVAVDGWLENFDHPGESFYCLFDSRTEPSRARE